MLFPQLCALALALLPQVATQGERESLEKLLERARAQRELVLKALAGQVAALVAQLEQLPKNATSQQCEPLIDGLVRLGAEATPLLVPYLDPGDGGGEKEKARAQHVATALARLDTSAVTSELLRVLATGSNEGRANVLGVLEVTTEPERVRPALLTAFGAAEGALKERCLRALLRLGGPEVDVLLAEVLRAPDRALAAMALAAVTQTKRAEVAPHVRKLLADPEFMASYALEVLAYFEACPELVREEEIRAMLKAALGNAQLSTRVALVEALPQFKPQLNPEFRRSMEPVLSSPEGKLREAGLVAMSQLGDKNARKELLKPYDELVEKTDTWSQAFARRAEIYFRIGELDKAIDDYKQALQNSARDPTVQPETHIGLARAYARRGKLKEAAETLSRAPISNAQLETLQEDPDFRELRASKYAKQAFGLK